ncbi:MAG: ABC transporter permease [Spirochaetaceae bacterium]|jgi:ABC-2 type transport system permease protein|nr:ABC transporter permease [Spirochaetaceae bacterium]
MTAIMKRELAAYFYAPIGYIYLGVIYFLSGYFLVTGVLLSNSTVLTPVFSVLINIIMVLTPLLTMRLMSEDRRRHTDQALLTAPVTLTGIVLGKFFAAALVYIAGVSVTLIYALVLNIFARINWAALWGNYIGILLLGFSFISIGQFISSLTENQTIAAIGGYAAMLGVFLLDAIPSVIPIPVLATVINGISFLRRYTPITHGILGLGDLFFFISVSGIFLFLTTRVLEKRRWS